MADVALTLAETESTDLTRMEGPGIEVDTDDSGRRVVETAAGHLVSGRRLIFRALLRQERGDNGASQIGIVASGFGRLGRLPAGVAQRYADVAAELDRHGRKGICSGYFHGGGSKLEVRLLLQEPDECLRRLEMDLTEPPRLEERGAALPR
jgi:hypothetical protein